MTTEAFELLILINPQVAPAGTYAILTDGVEAQRFTLPAKSGEVIEIRVPVPRAARTLTITRRSAIPVVGGMLGGAERTVDLVAVDRITAPLRDEPPAFLCAISSSSFARAALPGCPRPRRAAGHLLFSRR